MCARFELREQPKKPLRFCNTYVGPGGFDGVSGVGLVGDITEATSLIDGYDASPLHVTDVEVNEKLQRGLRQAFMVGVTGPHVLVRGRSVRLTLRLRRPRDGTFHRSFSMKVPRDAPRGPHELRLRGTPADAAGGSALGSLVEALVGDTTGSSGEESSGPDSLDELTKAVKDIERYDGVTASFRPPGSSDSGSGSGSDSREGEQKVLRDPKLRISGTATLDVTVR